MNYTSGSMREGTSTVCQDSVKMSSLPFSQWIRQDLGGVCYDVYLLHVLYMTFAVRSCKRQRVSPVSLKALDIVHFSFDIAVILL
jgi:hypothetical protein